MWQAERAAVVVNDCARRRGPVDARCDPVGLERCERRAAHGIIAADVAGKRVEELEAITAAGVLRHP